MRDALTQSKKFWRLMNVPSNIILRRRQKERVLRDEVIICVIKVRRKIYAFMHSYCYETIFNSFNFTYLLTQFDIYLYNLGKNLYASLSKQFQVSF